MSCRHFLTLLDLSREELRALLTRAIKLKERWQRGVPYEPMKNRVMTMIFEKSSTRTRVSFETAMAHFGGHAIFLSPRDTQLGRGEPIEDSARVLSRMTDIIMIRTFEHEKIELFAKHSRVPVINALTDSFHPCQLLADMQTYREHRGDIKGHTVAWIGDGNNMCHSYMNAAKQFEFKLRIACPKGYEPNAKVLANTREYVEITHDPLIACTGAHLITTDVWTSMGQEEEQLKRSQAFAGFKVGLEHMQIADKKAIFLHCLPAHRSEEVDAAVIDGPQSLVWDQAENRLHAQKALIEFLAVQAGIV